MIATRRGFLGGLIGLVAAPAVVKAENLMRIVAPPAPKIIYGPELYVPNLATDDFRRIVEPILNEEFDKAYATRAAEWEGIFRRVG